MSQGVALFNQHSKAPPRHILQFRAGKLTEDNDKRVVADPRKGYAYLYVASDGQLNFCWIDRTTRMVEDNFVVPKSAEMVHVSQCTTGRVYVLKINPTKRFFIWMQDPNDKTDSSLCNRFNNFIKTPPSLISGNDLNSLSQLSQSELLTLLTMGVGLGSGLSSDSEVSSAQAIASTIGRSHLNTMGLRSAAVSSIPLRQPDSGQPQQSSKTEQKFQLSDIRNMLSSASSEIAPIELSNVANVKNLKHLLESPEIQQRLLPHLPPNDPEFASMSNFDRLASNIRSPTFVSTLSSFSSAFRSGALAPVLAQFKLGDKADEAAQRGDLLAFSQSLEPTSSPPTPRKPDHLRVGDEQETGSPITPRDDDDDIADKEHPTDEKDTPMDTD